MSISTHPVTSPFIPPLGSKWEDDRGECRKVTKHMLRMDDCGFVSGEIGYRALSLKGSDAWVTIQAWTKWAENRKAQQVTD